MTTPITPAELKLTIDKSSLYTKLNALLSGHFSRPIPDDITILRSNPGTWPITISVKLPQTSNVISVIVEDYEKAGWSVILKNDSTSVLGHHSNYQPQYLPQTHMYGQRPMDDDVYTTLVFVPPLV